MTPMLFYGTLRRGEGNNRWALNNSCYIGEVLTNENFSLAGAGAVPFAWRDDKGAPLFAELWLVSDKDAPDIHAMEVGAGYFPIDTPFCFYRNGFTELNKELGEFFSSAIMYHTLPMEHYPRVEPDIYGPEIDMFLALEYPKRNYV